ncbi:hypothetical protein KM043_000708 [Ampulex compressa]|nr:hypothetical protein KM043_000708 [Ampulex compressa]
MHRKSFQTFLLAVIVPCITGASEPSIADMSKYASAYYDPSTGVELKGELEDSSRLPLSAVRIAFRGLPCNCEQLTCGCCAGVKLSAINLDQRACTNFTLDPQEFAIKMAVIMNQREIYAHSLSAKNPPPLCAPLPYLPIVTFCVRFFDIHTSGRNFHACIDFETRLVNSPILVLHFNCVKMGVDGISWLKPEDNSNGPPTKPAVSEPEIYDEVNFEAQDAEYASNFTSMLTPEEEDQIGQLKLRHLQRND